MSNKSRRSMKLAAGAILAGAAIPIAAAGTAWADDNSAPGPTAAAGTAPVAAASGTSDPASTEKLGQLMAQGLTYSEAKAVVQAENNGTPVEVSYDGKIVVNDNQGATPADQATAYSGATHDVAAAIGDGSSANAGADNSGAPVTGDTHDRAFADGTNAAAGAGSSGPAGSLATGTTGSYDKATDIGNNTAGEFNGATAIGNHDTATDKGNNTDGYVSGAQAYGDHSKATDIGNNIGSYNGASAGGYDYETDTVSGSHDTAKYVGDVTNNDSTGSSGSGACPYGCGANANGSNDTVTIRGTDDNTNVTGNHDTVSVVGSNADGTNASGNYGITDTGNNDVVAAGSNAEGDITATSPHFTYLP